MTPLDLPEFDLRMALAKAEERVTIVHQEYQKALDQVEKMHSPNIDKATRECDALKKAIAIKEFEQRECGLWEGDIYLQVPPNHALARASGQLDGMFDRPGCPFNTYWGHLKIVQGVYSKVWSVMFHRNDTFLTIHTTKGDEGEDGECKGWSSERVQEAYTWLGSELDKITSIAASSDQVNEHAVLVEPHSIPSKRVRR